MVAKPTGRQQTRPGLFCSLRSFHYDSKRFGQRPDDLPDLNICVQVNVDDEQSKSGVAITDAADLARQIADLQRLRFRGLMCLPAVREDFEAQREPFRRLCLLADQLGGNGLPVDTLSMGMSADFRAAVFEGSTMVRVGTAIFGARA